jgi:lysophospholipase L1-like esterase
MKKILCFGDSNTFGLNPKKFERYDEDTRWTGILSQKLADKYEIIEAGCNNRNGFVDNNEGNDELTGYKILPEYLKTSPNIVILAIGINDLQKFYRPTLDIISTGLTSMVETITKTGAKVLIISPPVLNNDILNGFFAFQFDETSIATSKSLPELYEAVAKQQNCDYININDYVSVSKTDGLHYTEQEHSKIAEVICDYIN